MDKPTPHSSPGFLAGQHDGFGQSVNGSSFIWENNGGYFDSNPGSGAIDDGSGILVAQLTVASGERHHLRWHRFLQRAKAGDLTFASFSVTTVPAPGALALLGLAGLGRRRRG